MYVYVYVHVYAHMYISVYICVGTLSNRGAEEEYG